MDRDAGLLAEIENDVLSDCPLGTTLRKCVILGGQVGSVELRDWAMKELRGYQDDDDVPDYRTIAALIFIDASTPISTVSHQQISVSSLPDWTRDRVTDSYTFKQGVDDLEALIERGRESGGEVKLSLPMAIDIGRVMVAASPNPYQQITALYWGISVAALQGIVGQVRTTLAELVAEMRAGTPRGAVAPSPEATAQAVNVAFHGKSRVTLNTSQATGVATSSTVTTSSTVDETGFWTTWRKVGAFIVGFATVASAVFAAAMLL